jgi:hypothetical protein
MSLNEETRIAPEAVVSPAPGRRLGLALLVIATAQLMLVLDSTSTPVNTRAQLRACQRNPRPASHHAGSTHLPPTIAYCWPRMTDP